MKVPIIPGQITKPFLHVNNNSKDYPIVYIFVSKDTGSSTLSMITYTPTIFFLNKLKNTKIFVEPLMDIIFRKAQISDLLNLHLMSQRYFHDFQKLDLLFLSFLLSSDYSFVCEINLEIQGAVICEKTDDKLDLAFLCVEAEYRNLGLGTKLVRKVIECAKEDSNIKGLELMVSIENLKAVHIYEKLGFRVISKIMKAYIDNTSGYIMRLDI